ncbi:hypothetical protein HDV63DRAFT_369051 [Trichoderma sp. SZMC 28014]
MPHDSTAQTPETIWRLILCQDSQPVDIIHSAPQRLFLRPFPFLPPLAIWSTIRYRLLSPPIFSVLSLLLHPLVKAGLALVAALSTRRRINHKRQLHHPVYESPDRAPPRRLGILAEHLLLPLAGRARVGNRGLLPRPVAPLATPVDYPING